MSETAKMVIPRSIHDLTVDLLRCRGWYTRGFQAMLTRLMKECGDEGEDEDYERIRRRCRFIPDAYRLVAKDRLIYVDILEVEDSSKIVVSGCHLLG